MNMPEDAPISYIVLKELQGNGVPQFGVLQQFLADHMQIVTFAWWIIFFLTLGTVIFFLLRDVRKNA